MFTKIKLIHGKKLLSQISAFLLLAFCFGISYAQKPLYSLSQNTHFLHGLANGGLGFLKNDWMYRTADLVPVFTFLVSMTYSKLHEYVFYFYYFFLLGVYIYSLMGIASIVGNINDSKTKYFACLAIFIALHSSVLSALSGKVLGINLSSALFGGVAGQQILGPLQPSMFGVFLILSVYLFLCKKPFLAVFFSSLAAIMHSAYILSAAVLALTYMLIVFKEGKSIRKPLSIGALAFIMILPVITYSYMLFGPTSPEILNNAQDILVNFRIPHHAVPMVWFGRNTIVRILIVVAAMNLTRRSRIFLVMALVFLVSVMLSVIQVLSGSNALALLFPWRLSVLLVPVSSCILLASLISGAFKIFRHQVSKYKKVLVAFSLVVIFIFDIGGIARSYLVFDRESKEDYIPVMDFVKETKSPGEIYLIPIRPVKLNKFRLYTGAPIFVDLITHPFKDVEVIEWYKRIQIAKNFYETQNNINRKALKELKINYKVTHVVLKNRQLNIRSSILKELYKDDKYGVYKIND